MGVLTPHLGPLPVKGRESSGLCARIAPRNLTRALLAGLDHKRMPALISNDLRVSKMGGYWAGSATDVQTMTKAFYALGCESARWRKRTVRG